MTASNKTRYNCAGCGYVAYREEGEPVKWTCPTCGSCAWVPAGVERVHDCGATWREVQGDAKAEELVQWQCQNCKTIAWRTIPPHTAPVQCICGAACWVRFVPPCEPVEHKGETVYTDERERPCPEARVRELIAEGGGGVKKEKPINWEYRALRAEASLHNILNGERVFNQIPALIQFARAGAMRGVDMIGRMIAHRIGVVYPEIAMEIINLVGVGDILRDGEVPDDNR